MLSYVYIFFLQAHSINDNWWIWYTLWHDCLIHQPIYIHIHIFCSFCRLISCSWNENLLFFLFLSNAVAVNYLLAGNKVKAITRRLIKLCHVKSENRSKIPFQWTISDVCCIAVIWWCGQNDHSFIHHPRNGLSCLCHIRVLCLFPLFTQIRIFYLKFDL